MRRFKALSCLCQPALLRACRADPQLHLVEHVGIEHRCGVEFVNCLCGPRELSEQPSEIERHAHVARRDLARSSEGLLRLLHFVRRRVGDAEIKPRLDVVRIKRERGLVGVLLGRVLAERAVHRRLCEHTFAVVGRHSERGFERRERLCVLALRTQRHAEREVRVAVAWEARDLRSSASARLESHRLHSRLTAAAYANSRSACISRSASAFESSSRRLPRSFRRRTCSTLSASAMKPPSTYRSPD
eukprot:4357519-Pleurochrysis_carterae.AAC.2